MNYIVCDLEFNQKYIPSNTTDKNNNESIDSTMKQLPFEIIQIGAVKINENLEITSNFNELIRPIVYTEDYDKIVQPHAMALNYVYYDIYTQMIEMTRDLEL